MSEAPVVVERRLPAPPERVFRAFTCADDLRRWWRTTPGHTTPIAEVDARPGGTYRLGMTGPSGTTYVVEGVFRTVDRPRRLVYSWRWISPQASAESGVTVTLEPEGASTALVVAHDGLADEPRRRAHAEAWRACLASLDAMLADEADSAT